MIENNNSLTTRHFVSDSLIFQDLSALQGSNNVEKTFMGGVYVEDYKNDNPVSKINNSKNDNACFLQ